MKKVTQNGGIPTFKKKETWIVLAGILMLFTILYLSSDKNDITGLVVGFFSLTEQKLSQNLRYADNINLDVNDSVAYSWIIENLCNLENCILKSINISGYVIANNSGNINIYIENSGNLYLIFNKSFELNKTIIPQNITAEQNITVINEATIQTVNTTEEVNFTIEQPEIFYFNDSCIETCNLMNGFNKNYYNLRFNLSHNISLRIYSIKYSWGELTSKKSEGTAEVTNSSFDEARIDKPHLPKDWYVQQSGSEDFDEACINESSWTLTKESYSGKKAIAYNPSKDTLACGIKLASFKTKKIGNISLEFYFKENFTNPSSYFEILNYGNDNCNVKFNRNDIVEEVECWAAMTDVGNGWKKISIIWPIYTSEPIHLFFTPPFILNDTGMIIFDEVSIKMVK